MWKPSPLDSVLLVLVKGSEFHCTVEGMFVFQQVSKREGDRSLLDFNASSKVHNADGKHS